MESLPVCASLASFEALDAFTLNVCSSLELPVLDKLCLRRCAPVCLSVIGVWQQLRVLECSVHGLERLCFLPSLLKELRLDCCTEFEGTPVFKSLEKLHLIRCEIPDSLIL